jgi:NADH-quinone oxidoreductase subunit N
MNAIIILASLGILSMLAEIFQFKNILWYLILLGLGVVFTVNAMDWNLPESGNMFSYMMLTDNYAVAFTGLIIVLAMIWFLIAYHQYYESTEFNISDHFSLILFSSVGALVLVSFSHLSMLFLGIEILSIPLYILAGSMKKNPGSNEAALKYFMLGAFATGILLFGIAFIYGATGTFNIYEIGNYVKANNGNVSYLFYTGLLMIMIALGFKVSAVPFHFWTPDVYQGAPAIITAFMATIVKTAAFAGFFRLFYAAFSGVSGDWMMTLGIITALTILVGNILAVSQSSVKRMLAYSGVSQAGYLLMAILVLNEETRGALWLYTASYSVATLGAFAVLYHVIKTKGSDSIEAFHSLGKNHPMLAFVMAVAMLSLAGIPPAIGFFAKFYLFSNVLSAGNQYLWIVIIAVIGSLISVYYYFKIIIGMYAKEGETSPLSIGTFYKALLIIITGLLIIMGLTPGFLVGLDGFKI